MNNIVVRVHFHLESIQKVDKSRHNSNLCLTENRSRIEILFNFTPKMVCDTMIASYNYAIPESVQQIRAPSLNGKGSLEERIKKSNSCPCVNSWPFFSREDAGQ